MSIDLPVVDRTTTYASVLYPTNPDGGAAPKLFFSFVVSEKKPQPLNPRKKKKKNCQNITISVFDTMSVVIAGGTRIEAHWAALKRFVDVVNNRGGRYFDVNMSHDPKQRNMRRRFMQSK